MYIIYRKITVVKIDGEEKRRRVIN